MADGVRLAWLREEVGRLGAMIDAPPHLLVSFDPYADMGTPYIDVEPDGPTTGSSRSAG